MTLAKNYSYAINRALSNGELQQARSLMFHWLQDSMSAISNQYNRQDLRQPELWRVLADVVERTSDQYLLELFWQAMDQVTPCQRMNDGSNDQRITPLPLLGVPILNRPDLLLQLLQSLDHPVTTLAVVDNSRGSKAEHAVNDVLSTLEKSVHPYIERVVVARPFGNAGVAASWNQILRSFPSANVALLINNDVQLAAGVLRQALNRLDSRESQFLPLLPAPQEFSAFLITARCWDHIGLFDEGFYPAYCEDLDYRDRLRANPAVQYLRADDLQQTMADLNPQNSATISSDRELAARNAVSFALNRLWWLSHRRLRHDPRGTWLRQWLCEWMD